MKQKLILLITLFSFSFLSEDYQSDKNTIDLLNRIVSKYEKNMSFSLIVKDGEIKNKMAVDLGWINDDKVFRKTRLRFLDSSNLSGVHVWVWSMKDGKDKKWITKPGSGKKIDVSKKKQFDLPSILPSQSILKGYHVPSDTLIFNNKECVVIDVFKISKGKKKGPFTKLWIDIENDLIYKIEDFDYRKNDIIKETIMDYYNSSDSNYVNLSFLPKKIQVNDYRTKKNSTIEIIDYELDKKFDIKIFEPIDIK